MYSAVAQMICRFFSRPDTIRSQTPRSGYGFSRERVFQTRSIKVRPRVSSGRRVRGEIRPRAPSGCVFTRLQKSRTFERINHPTGIESDLRGLPDIVTYALMCTLRCVNTDFNRAIHPFYPLIIHKKESRLFRKWRCFLRTFVQTCEPC